MQLLEFELITTDIILKGQQINKTIRVVDLYYSELKIFQQTRVYAIPILIFFKRSVLLLLCIVIKKGLKKNMIFL